MAEGISLSTIGMYLSYAVEASEGVRPTTGYTKIVGAKSIPAVGGTTETIDASTLEDEYTVYVPGRKDTGGELPFTFNGNDIHIEAWNKMVEAAGTAQAANKRMWFAIVHPDMKNAFYFAGMPATLGFGGAEGAAVLEQPSPIVPSKVDGWATKPTTTTI